METIGSNFVPQIPIIKEAGRLLPPFNFNLCPEFFNSSGFPNLTRRIACPPLESLRESALIGKIQQEGDFDQLDNQRYIDWRKSSSKRQFDQIVKTERSLRLVGVVTPTPRRVIPQIFPPADQY